MSLVVISGRNNDDGYRSVPFYAMVRNPGQPRGLYHFRFDQFCLSTHRCDASFHPRNRTLIAHSQTWAEVAHGEPRNQ